jgi:oxygenase catalysing oxidative methylation of damaged DNA
VRPTTAGPIEIAQRIGVLDWSSKWLISTTLELQPWAPFSTRGSAMTSAPLYDQTELFRSTIDLAPHRFGEGQYRYFAHPLPQIVAELRAAFWPQLLLIARDWAARLERPAPWPDGLDVWIAQCHAAGQTRPTSLMLRYDPATGTRSTETCTATSSSLYRSSSDSTPPAPTTRAASSWSSSSDYELYRGQPRARSPKDTASCSPPESGPSHQRLVDGLLRRCATGSACCTADSATPWDSFSTTPRHSAVGWISRPLSQTCGLLSDLSTAHH